MDGILILSFGTASRESRERTIDVLIEECQEAFPEMPVYLAFLGRGILKKIYEQEGVNIDTPEEALKRMCLEEITRVFIQPVYMINGKESGKLLSVLEKYKKFFPGGIYMGEPLICNSASYSVLLEAMAGDLEKYVSRETCSEALFLVGHGGEHSANLAYPAFDYFLKEKGYEHVYVGTLKGYPGIDTLLGMIQKKEVKKVILMPFMFYAGEHVMKDMDGNEEYSWKRVLEQYGYEVECVLHGLGENKKIRECYINHVRNLIETIKHKQKNNES